MPTLTTLVLVAAAVTAPATLRTLPHLGDPVPAALLKAKSRTCQTGALKPEPCTEIRVRRDHITLAWNPSTRLVTFLYSTTLLTDSELATGGSGRITRDDHLLPFRTGFISAEWCDTDTRLSGDALWCPVMKPEHGTYFGRVIGFVQSVYLDIPDLDSPTRGVAE